jgi:hypothetical protein
VDVQRIDKRKEDGYTGDTSQARQDTDDRAGQHAGREHSEMKRIRKPLQSD